MQLDVALLDRQITIGVGRFPILLLVVLRHLGVAKCRLKQVGQQSANRLEQVRSGAVHSRSLLVFGVVVVALAVLIVLASRVRRLGWLHGLQIWKTRAELERSRIDFYERLVALLAARGLTREPHQTPLEFASAVGPAEVGVITAAYNRVRFGSERLSDAETRAISEALKRLEGGAK